MPPPKRGWTRVLDRIETGLDWMLSAIAVVVLVFMVALVFYAVVMRYAFNNPVVFSYDLSTLVFAWIVFLGLYVAERDGAHIGLDILHLLKTDGARHAIAVIRQLFLIALAGYMTVIGTQLLLRTGMQIPSMRISARWLYGSLPAGFAMLTLIYLLRLPRIAFGHKA